jgi:putative ABC transport system substrate-binding protein
MLELRRRQFLTLLGGTVAAWPLAARAQQGERVRRIGVLVHGSQTGAVWQQRLAAFRDGLEGLGWQEGRNIRIETLFSDNNYDRLPTVAHELVEP